MCSICSQATHPLLKDIRKPHYPMVCIFGLRARGRCNLAVFGLLTCYARYLAVHEYSAGKAKNIYYALSTAQCSDYGLVKEKILQAYELVPEAYRQKFRNLVKQSEQTHVEFPKEKENAFDWWLSSMKVDDYDNLIQLVLVEEFINVSADIRVPLGDHKVPDLKNQQLSQQLIMH